MKREHTRSMNFWQSTPRQNSRQRNSTNAWEVSSLQTTGITSIRFGFFSCCECCESSCTLGYFPLAASAGETALLRREPLPFPVEFLLLPHFMFLLVESHNSLLHTIAESSISDTNVHLPSTWLLEHTKHVSAMWRHVSVMWRRSRPQQS